MDPEANWKKIIESFKAYIYLEKSVNLIFSAICINLNV